MKCDEEKPKCQSCNRRQTPCQYSNDGLNQLASAASVASSPYERPEISYNFTPNKESLTSTNTPYGNNVVQTKGQPLSSLQPSPTSLNMAHLELLHHWVAVTSYAITIGKVSHKVWCLTIPQIALSQEFLMHTILAVAALHKAHLEPEHRNEYWNRAAMHQDRAMQLQQVAMANPGPDNADALFVFSLMIIYLAFASPVSVDSQQDNMPLQGVIQCIHMLRGVHSIIPPIRHWVQQGPLGHLLLMNPSNIRSEPTFPDSITEEHFTRLLIFCSTTPDLNGQIEMEDVENFAAAASSLRASFLKAAAVVSDSPNTPPIWHWGVRLPFSFVERLADRHVVPLVLVAHWCALLAQIQHYWWVEGWVDRNMGEIEQCLPQEHHQWLEWPKQQIRENWEKRRHSEENREPPPQSASKSQWGPLFNT